VNSHTEGIEKDLPQLKFRETALEKRLVLLEEEQDADTQTIDLERKKNEDKVAALQGPLESNKVAIEKKRNDLQTEQDSVREPICGRIQELISERGSHEQQIVELEKEIARYRQLIQDLDKQRRKEELQLRKIDIQFQARVQAIDKEAADLAAEQARFDAKVKEIEAPLQGVITAVNRRKKEIETVKNSIEGIKRQVTEARSDVDGKEETQAALATLIEL
jgi:chromosome segregation ATPase